MACAGIDFGSRRSVVAIARRGGVDICCNEVSNRATPSLVSFSREERHIGESAANFQAQNPKNTVSGIQRLLGVVDASPFARDEAARLTTKVIPTASGGVAVSVAYGTPDEHGDIPQVELPFESMAGMLFSSLLKIASDEYKAPVKDCVITVPGYYTDAQRRAVMDAAAIGNVNVLRVLNEHAAIALSYGIFRTSELPATDPIKVAFVDMGDAGTTVCVAAFTKTRADVLSVAYEPSLGGRDFDTALANVFAEQFKEKHGIDALSQPRPKLRLLKESEKCKRILSANVKAPLNIECLMSDVDVTSSITRDEFEALIEPLAARFKDCCNRAVADANIASTDELFAVEIVGASTRVPAVKNAVQEVFKCPMKTTLNMDECVARGAALMSAILSPAFRVREYGLSDVSSFAVDAKKVFDNGTPEETLTLIPALNQLPCVKAMSFKSSGPFNLFLGYNKAACLAQGDAAASIASYEIRAPEDPEAKVRAKIRLNENGIVELSSVTLSKEVEVEVIEQPKAPVADEPKKESVAAENGKKEDVAAPGDEPMKDAPDAEEAKTGEPVPMAVDTEAVDITVDTTPAEAVPEPVKRMVKKVEQTDVEFLSTSVAKVALSRDEVKSAIEREAQMKAADLYLKERGAAFNGLESYVYDLRSRIGDYGDLKDFGPEDVRAPLQKELDDIEEWLYSDEGEKSSKSAFVDRKAKLVEKASPMLMRKREVDERPSAVRALEATFEVYKRLAVPCDEYAHIPDVDKSKALKCVEDAALWLKKESEKQASIPKSEDPVLTCASIIAKRAEVDTLCSPIQKLPKPAPPKPEPKEPKTEEKAADTNGTTPQENGDDKSVPADAEKSGEAPKPADAAKTPETDSKAVNGKDTEPVSMET